MSTTTTDLRCWNTCYAGDVEHPPHQILYVGLLAMIQYSLTAIGCYPFQDKDPFVIEDCPHVFLVGNQPKFETTVIEGPLAQQVRLIAVSKFIESGEVVLLSCDTLEVEVMKFDVFEAEL